MQEQDEKSEVKSMAAQEKEVNLAALRTEYIIGEETLKALAEKYGASLAYIRKISGAEKWTEQRRQYREQVGKDAIKGAGKAAARKLMSVQQAVDRLSARIAKLLEDEEQFNRHIVTETESQNGHMTSTQVETIFLKADTYAIKNLTGALKDLTAIIRDVYGLRTAQEDAALEYARARVESERRKAEAESGDEELRVIMDEEADEYAG